MKFVLLAPVSAALLLAACTNNDSTDTVAQTDGPDATESPAQGATGENPNGGSKSAIDPDTPASQFGGLEDASTCLGVAWQIGGDKDKDRVRVQFANMIGGDRFARIKDAFAIKDYIASLEQEVEARVAPYATQRLYSFTTKVGDDPYREYNLENQSFFDSSDIIWGSSARVFTQQGGGGGTPAHCVIHWTNGGKWAGEKSGFTVRDEQEARAASAALAARKSAVKVYFHVDDVDQSKTMSEWPQVEARILRIELVDQQGVKLAKALPLLSDEELAAKVAAEAQYCGRNPLDCM